MKNKILANLSYWLCAFLGLFQFILFAIPYLSSFVKMYGVKETYGNMSGYKVMDLWQAEFSGVMSSLLQVFILILGIVMLAYGVCGILKSFGLFEAFPDSVGKYATKKYGEFALYAYAGLNFLLFIFLIILTATNTESYDDFWSGEYKAGICFSAGMFITLIFAIAAPVALKLLEAKCPVVEETEKVTYACSGCGKKVRQGVNFCPACGGAVESKVDLGVACTQCGKKVKKGVNFCPDCGGKVEAVTAKEETTVEEVAVAEEAIATEEKTEE